MKLESPEFYLTTLDNGWTVGRFHALDEVAGITHAVTTRQGLDVQLARNDHAGAAAKLAVALGCSGMAFLNQVHGGVVLPVDRSGEPRTVVSGLVGDADGLVTDRAGLGLMTRGADCPLILAVDPVRWVIGTAHASWRSTTCRIAEELVRQMTGMGAAADRIIACICPSAGPCCYEVGPDVLEAMTQKVGPHTVEFFRATPEKKGQTLDLWSANRDQLLRAGLREKNIHISGVCTMCANDVFPSHRREGAAAGRFAAGIGLAPLPEGRGKARPLTSVRGSPEEPLTSVRGSRKGRL